MFDHVRKTCATEAKPHGCDEGYGCMLCNLFYCGACHGFEGSLPSECPGSPISEEDQQLIYQATLDFRDGSWVNRPLHDWEIKRRAGQPGDQVRQRDREAKLPAVLEAVTRLNAARVLSIFSPA